MKSSGNERREKKEGATDHEVRDRRVFVGNLSFKTSWQRVKDHMKDMGTVVRVDLFTNKDGRPKGCGYLFA